MDGAQAGTKSGSCLALTACAKPGVRWLQVAKQKRCPYHAGAMTGGGGAGPFDGGVPTFQWPARGVAGDV